MLTSIDVKLVFDSARLGLFCSGNILQIADIALRAVFLLFLPCFQPLFRLVLTLESSLLKRVKSPPFIISQPQQINLDPRSSRLMVH